MENRKMSENNKQDTKNKKKKKAAIGAGVSFGKLNVA